jgi:hypothetical protein
LLAGLAAVLTLADWGRTHLHRMAGPSVSSPALPLLSVCRSKGTLAGDYWIGLNRSSSTADYMYFNGTEAPDASSNGLPYAHWSWYHPTFRASAGYDCILAWWVARKEAFLCRLACLAPTPRQGVPASIAPPPTAAAGLTAGLT